MFLKIRHLFSFLFGDFSWRPPAWLMLSARRIFLWVQAHQRLGASLALSTLLVSAAGWGTWHWYRHLPQPKTISVSAEPPDISPVAKKIIPSALTIRFSGAVAKIDAGGEFPIPSGIRLDPPFQGSWGWSGDRTILFHPKTDWPAGQKFRVILDPSLFPARVLLAKYEIEFQTPEFKAAFDKIEFYTDLKDPSVKQVVATLSFSHSVDPADLEKLLLVEAIGGSPVFKAGQPRFSLSYDAHHRYAYLRTSPLTLPESEDFMRVTLAKGVHTTQGGRATEQEIEDKVRIPDLYSFFHIESVKGLIVSNKEGEPDQILMVETSIHAAPEEIAKALHVYLLPEKVAQKTTDSGEETDQPDAWDSPANVDEDVLRKSTLLPVKLVPSEQATSTTHAFKISLESNGQLFVSVAKNTRALGGYLLRDDYRTIVPVPKLPREVAIEGDGGVLALDGERKIAIRSRGVRVIEYTIARVPADQINHLVSQTSGAFQNPEFVNSHFDEQNIARIATERQSINVTSAFKANYSSFDFPRHLGPTVDGGSPMQGLFFLKAREYMPPKAKKKNSDDPDSATEPDSDSDSDDDTGDNETSASSDSRFILVTDLGIIVKENADESRDVFIASIKTGRPLANVAVEVLAKNGVPLVSGKTDSDGRVAFASLGKTVREKRAVAFVARNGNDVAFMPYSREDRKLDFSRFDIDGVQSRSGADLDACVFTERGIYRPGDEIHLGLIVKQRNWRGKLEGLPVEVEVLDARGNAALVRKLALPPMGFAEAVCPTAADSPTGVYDINLYLVRDGKRGSLLGSASATVKEFLPDRMKIESHLSKESAVGWITPADVHAAVTLRNLYGTPATDRRIKANLVLSPAEFGFDRYPDYRFFDRLREGKDADSLKSQRIDLGEQNTDAKGAAAFDLDLERFGDATYALDFFVEGFEAGGGRSVSTRNSALVSPLPYVIGFKSDGNLSYIPMGSRRSLRWIAIDPSLTGIAVDQLECRLIERRYLSVLSKQEDGDYAYESVLKEEPLHANPVAIAAEGLDYPLPTDTPGDYVLELRDKDGNRLSKVSFSVVGRGSVSRSVEKSAELQVKLSAPAYKTGDDIEVSIVAPYTGSGLITIERDKVYAAAWFQTDKNSSIQHIRVPEGFEGTGYLNVCFVRGLDSKEVFMSPLSYAVVPFQANIDQRRLQIGLRIPAKTVPGEPLRIAYKADRPSRIAVFAVDQGILQVTGYELPDPLGRFFRKEALMVGTAQIVDLLLPEFSLLRQASAFGGDGEPKRLNPFKRVTDKPVVFWSGILDAEPREREVVYDVPDYFSGTLTVMAVAVAPDAVGSASRDCLVRGPFVLTPNVPTVAAPGDQFQVSVTVANGVEGSGPQANVRLVAEASEHLEIINAPSLPIAIPEGAETSAAFTVRARDKFGSANLLFRAAIDRPQGGASPEARIRSTLSVRPAMPFMTTVQSGNFTGDSADVHLDRRIHPDYRKLDSTVSALPLGLARGLDAYLSNYPNGCSEQISSGAFCRLMLSGEADFGLSRAVVASQMEQTFSILRSRQNAPGSFGYWAADGNEGIDFISVYVMHFLIEAKAAGFAPPPAVFESGLHHLQAMVVLNPSDLREARIQAYAIYLLTREGVVTTNYILNLRDTLDKQYEKKWSNDLTGVYLAGSLALLKKNDEAQRLIKEYRLGHQAFSEYWDFYSALGADAQYFAILARHFPALLEKTPASSFQAVLRPIGRGEFNTLSAAYAVLALKSYSQHLSSNAPVLGITQILGDDRTLALHADGGPLLKRALFSADAASLRFTAKNQAKGLGSFYQVVEAGYDQALPSQPVTEGLEVFREFLDDKKQVTHTARLGEPITVRLRVRTIHRGDATNVALIDLLPGGFEVVNDSLRPGVGSAGCDYVDVREDRTLFYGTFGTTAREITYQIKPVASGDFIVPPVFAESMYEPAIHARGLASRITVTAAP